MENYYKTIHILRYEFKYSTESVESMLPWELDVELAYIAMSIKEAIKKRNQTM